MNTISNTSARSHPKRPSRFSWRRVGSLAAFFRPMIEKQTLLYLIVSVVVAILTLLPVHEVAQIALFTISWTVIPYMVQFAPCIMAKSGDARIVERLIPASAAEKFIFRLIYFLLVVPVVSYLLPDCALLLYREIPSIQNEGFTNLVDLALHNSLFLRVLNLFTMCASVLTCLYTVSRVRTNRVLKGVVSVFAVNISVGLLGALWGTGMAFRLGFCDGQAGIQPNTEQFNLRLRESFTDSAYMYVVLGVVVLYVIYMLVLNYRILRRHNL